MIFNYTNPKVEVVLKDKEVEANSDASNNARLLFFEAITSKKPNTEILEYFHKFNEGYYTNSEETKQLLKQCKQSLRQEGKPKIYDFPYDILPKNFQDYCENLKRELITIISNTYKNLTWFQGLDYGTNPFQRSAAEASLDGVTWFGLPGRSSVGFEMVKGILRSEKKKKKGHILTGCPRIQKSPNPRGGQALPKREIVGSRGILESFFLNPKSLKLFSDSLSTGCPRIVLVCHS